MKLAKPVAELPKPKPVFTCWPAVTEDGVHMARVKLDVGQYSFQAGKEYDPIEIRSFADAVKDVMHAIVFHAKERKWY